MEESSETSTAVGDLLKVLSLISPVKGASKVWLFSGERSMSCPQSLVSFGGI